jgi:GT2 family glycosyltransferase
MKKNSQPDLTISIGTCENYKVIDACLSSIFNNPVNIRFEVYVVDNYSNDGSIDKIEKEFPEVHVIRNETKNGFCHNHNQVIKRSRSRYVLLLDDDVVILEGALDKMVAFMDEHPEAGIAGCKTIYKDGTFQKSYGLIPTLKTEYLSALGISNMWPDRIYKDTFSVKEVGWLNGPFLMARPKAIDEVGMLDEKYFTVFCESDWCFRMKKHGWKVLYNPDTQIIHSFQSITQGEIQQKKTINYLRHFKNRYYFFQKHYGSGAYFLLRFITMIEMINRSIYSLINFFRGESSGSYVKMQIGAFLKIFKFSFLISPSKVKL